MSSLIGCHRKGSTTNDALVKLFALAGVATALEWRKAMKWRQPSGAFDHAVLIPLVEHGMIFRRGDTYRITDIGCEAIGIDPNVTCGAGEVVPPPASPAAHRPALSRGSLFGAIPFRDGSLDYRDIPSRHGDQSIPHRKA
jgi:hypothetical protein